MRPFRKAFVVALALALPLAAVSAEVSSDTTPGVNFAAYTTFSFASTTPPAGLDPVAFERIVMDVQSGLEGKGYTNAAQGGDLSVIITVGEQDKTDVSSWGRFGLQTDVYQYTQGQLSVDVFDTKTKQPLWHGQATETVNPGRTNPAKIDKEVGEVMARFPARA